MDTEAYKKLLLDENESDDAIFNALLELLDDTAPLLPEIENGELHKLTKQHRPEVSIRIHTYVLESFSRSDADRINLAETMQLDKDASYLDMARAMYEKGED